ncbi:WxL domain-containing protein [Enterococcus faecalis]|uniref:WxL domain-containing protein n=1 Tax=Enterococcus faecalis TaxID=1351 RepID=UPI00243217A1|nr:WxL domain-containing protein [Enterococcus faecalis]EMC2391832.1 WxL domain-containing protein [Enterococcus faecalis]MDN3128525.1 WxL domain-containing protein [Enterococcus faecalis]HBI2076874.1 WxL domain-containing protein [Enterococcus faecalis]
MKRNKWQRLATIGLCSSLVINAFSGVTAVAETVTIESSPTAESSAKEETQASSVKEETTKASTENSQVTTDTSQEEETKEAEKQSESPLVTPEIKIDTTEQAPANSSENDLQKSLSPRWVPNNQVIYPRMLFNFTDETGKAFADENLTLSGSYFKLGRYVSTNKWHAYEERYPIISFNSGNGQYQVLVNASVPLPYNFYSNRPAGFDVNIYAVEKLKIDNTLKYVDSIVSPNTTIRSTLYSSQQTSDIPQFGNHGTMSLPTRDRVFTKDNANVFSIGTAVATDITGVILMMKTTSVTPPDYPILVGFDGTTTFRETINYKVTRKQVTEKFVDANGVAITPPTGFTQNKKTPMTSNAFTFKQAGTLPDTYTAGGKTYKFKGWYKGKTKPSTLTTTKAPSYAVTYDGNDDLNVVYEEATKYPEETYQFGFVNQDGNLVKPDDIVISYDYASFSFKDNSETWNTIASNQKATTSGNLKNVVKPSSSVPNPTVNLTGNGDHFINFSISLPKYYTELDIYDKSGKISSKYPLPPRHYYKNNEEVTNFMSDADLISQMTLSKSTSGTYVTKDAIQTPENLRNTGLMIMRRYVGFSENQGAIASYFSLDAPFYYHLTQRKVTENFVDTSGAKITAPSGFTQGKQTVINSDPYTFKQAGTLPDTYTTGGKTYKFKGWYKGKTKTEPLTTTKAPSYPVTYDDNDDLNVVYEEETVTTFYPSLDVNFVDEKGTGFTPALTFSGKYYVRRTSDNVITNLYDVTSKSNGNGQYTVSINNGSVPLSQELFKEYTNGYLPISTNSLTFRLDKLAIDQQLKYVDSIQVETAQSSGLNVYRYDYTNNSSTIIDSSVAPTISNLPTADINGLNFKTDGTNFSNTSFRFLGMTIGGSMNANGIYLFHTNLFSNNPTNDSKLVYKVTRKQVTENFVDANGAKITAPTGFTQGNQIPMTSNTFKYTAAKALPATYTAGGKVYTFQGWYKGKTKPSTLNKTTTPTFNATFDGNDDMTAMYQEEVPKASVALTRTTAETVASGGNVTWRATITNPSKAPLTTATIKKSTAWTTGLAAPTSMIVTPVGGTAKTVPVTATTWTNGVSLGIDIPAGKTATVQFTTKATGTAGQVLRAGITTSGNYSGVSASATVRVKDNDQEIVTPTTEGFISVPTFDFGQVGVAGTKQQHSLKKAADYYGNGTRNPYLRIKKTQPNWRLTAQLSQPKSATDSLPTATRLLLGAAPVSSFANYNLPTELKNAVGTTSAISLTANNTATSIIANQQFTGSNVYQLDFAFNNVKLEVPANQGVKGQQYKAAVTWNLVTGP